MAHLILKNQNKMLDGDQKHAQDTWSNEIQSPIGPSYSFFSTKLRLNSFWFLPTRWRDNRCKVLFQLAPFFKKRDILKHLRKLLSGLLPSPLFLQVQFTFSPKIRWHFFRWAWEKSCILQRVGSKDKDSVQGHRQKGKGQTWMSQGLAQGLGIRK